VISISEIKGQNKFERGKDNMKVKFEMKPIEVKAADGINIKLEGFSVETEISPAELPALLKAEQEAHSSLPEVFEKLAKIIDNFSEKDLAREARRASQYNYNRNKN
jgi:hypothetical protein